MEGEFFFYRKCFHETLELIMKIRTIKHLEKNQIHGLGIGKIFLISRKILVKKEKVYNWTLINKKLLFFKVLQCGNDKATQEWGEFVTIHITFKGCHIRL